MAYRLRFGDFSDDLCVLHRCDKPVCCNPAHLFLGTHADNVADKIAKGRQGTPVHKRGSEHPMATITEHTAQAIFMAEGLVPDVARRFGVSPGIVSRIRQRTAWDAATEGLVPPDRGKRGSKVNAEIAAAIFATTGDSFAEIGRRFGVSWAIVRCIHRGVTWNEVTGLAQAPR